MAKYLLGQRRWDVLGRAEAAGMVDVNYVDPYSYAPDPSQPGIRAQVPGRHKVTPLMEGAEGFGEMHRDVEGMQPGRFTPGFGAAEAGRLALAIENLNALLQNQKNRGMTPVAPVNMPD